MSVVTPVLRALAQRVLEREIRELLARPEGTEGASGRARVADTPSIAASAGESSLPAQRGAGETSAVEFAAAGAVFSKLRAHLGRLIGTAGVDALFHRARALASPEFPGLQVVRIEPDGRLTRIDGLTPDSAEDQTARSLLALLANLLGLIALFIGEDLVLRVIGEVWPDLPAGGAEHVLEERP
jgi:hypothetical protein